MLVPQAIPDTTRSALQAEMGFGGTFCLYCGEYRVGVEPQDGNYFCCDPRPGIVPLDHRGPLQAMHKAEMQVINAYRVTHGLPTYD